MLEILCPVELRDKNISKFEVNRLAKSLEDFQFDRSEMR